MPKRLLVIRLDRIGDVVLSTPVLEALRSAFPHLYLAMMVRPACEELVKGNPNVNEVPLYDKDGAHHNLLQTIRFAWWLRRYRFDTALVLHPTNRSHWIPWLAGIPVRIGYNRKSAWLLTHRLPHRKQEGARHETEYTLELLAPFGIVPQSPVPYVPIQPSAAQRVEAILKEWLIQPTDRLVAIHPSASCRSKRWMPERFAQVADRLIVEQGVRMCLVAGGGDDARATAEVLQCMQRKEAVLNLGGQLSIGELAPLFHRCALLISNDSGPVHIAAAVGTPVVAIFGRNQPGLSAPRWGPLGRGHIVLQKDVGCVTCLAHACDIEFLCLTSLSIEDVYRAAVSVLKQAASDQPSHISG